MKEETREKLNMELRDIPLTERQKSITRVKAIQLKTIQDLEECLLDYAKTENALNEIEALNLQNKKSGVKKENLYVYDQRVRQKNKQANPQQPKVVKTEKSQITQFLEGGHPDEMPPTNVKIFHAFANEEHFYHPINVTLRNTNFIIKLLFKNTKEQQALTSCTSPASNLFSRVNIDQVEDSNPHTTSMATFAPQNHLLPEEVRLKQIQDIAKYMKISIPKRLD